MDKPRDKLFLVGPMGAGKTTIGRQLARALSLEFVDSDHVIEARTGANIPWIFDIEGEAGFRRRERDAIADICRRPGIVLATGGGAILDVDNRRDLMTNGTVIYLQTSIDKIIARTGKNQNRPLLNTDSPRARIEQLLAERAPLYEEIADIVVNTDRRGIKSTVNQILRQLNLLPDERGRTPKRRSLQARHIRT